MLWSFVDIFRWTALVTFAAACMVLLFRRISHQDDGSVRTH
jgi:hypothetical protein